MVSPVLDVFTRSLACFRFFSFTFGLVCHIFAPARRVHSIFAFFFLIRFRFCLGGFHPLPPLFFLVFFSPVDASLCMALVLALCTWPLNFCLEGKFDMTCWAFAFPLDALAGAAVTVYGYTGYEAMRVSVAVIFHRFCGS